MPISLLRRPEAIVVVALLLAMIGIDFVNPSAKTPRIVFLRPTKNHRALFRDPGSRQCAVRFGRDVVTKCRRYGLQIKRHQLIGGEI